MNLLKSENEHKQVQLNLIFIMILSKDPMKILSRGRDVGQSRLFFLMKHSVLEEKLECYEKIALQEEIFEKIQERPSPWYRKRE